MSKVWDLCRDFGLSAVLVLMLVAALAMLLVREYKISEYRRHSVKHSILIDLHDHCTIEEATAIQRNLEETTQQKVVSIVYDDSSQEYLMEVQFPPEQMREIVGWLLKRKWVEEVHVEN